MQAVVRLVAAVATVMHLTCGCCLHAAHLGCGNDPGHDTACCHAAADCVAEAADACACDAHACSEITVAPVAADATHWVVLSAATGNDHDCSGCDCVADAPASGAAAAWRPLECGVAAAVEARLIIEAAAAAARVVDDGEPPTIPARHPLHERLLL